MTSLGQASKTNVEYTLNTWMTTDLAAFSLPSWIATMPPVVFNWTEIQNSVPCFSVVHFPGDLQDIWQGRRLDSGQGLRASGMMEVSCWASSTDPNYLAILNYMADMVMRTAAATGSKTIYDFASSPYSPTATAYWVGIGDTTPNTMQQDKDVPSIWRIRILVSYHWEYRA